VLKNSGRFNESIKKEALARRQMKNVVQSNQWFMEIFASRLLDLMNTENITDLTLENLELNLTVSSDVELNGMKLTRLVRMLKLSSFKAIMKDQALKRGIRIHLVSAAHTSKECPNCHKVDKRNRNKDVFKCISCGLEGEADFNAGGTILGRTEVEKLNTVDENGCIAPKKLKRGTIKNIISDLKTPYNFIDKSGCSAPIRRYKPMIDSIGRFVLYCSADGEKEIKLKLSENQKTSVRELLAVA
jgi:ribosomal protein L37AE/L43A